MNTQQETVVIVEDSPTLALTYKSYLTPLNINIKMAETGEQALHLITETKPDVILLDLKLPDMDGIDILKRLSAEQIKSRVIVITAHGSVTVAVEAMREGASDFLLKPFTAERLTTTVNNALEISRLSSLVQRIGPGPRSSFYKFIGESPVMQAVYRMIEDSAPSRASVFIVGPSGTGKELAAEAIHHLSPRRNKRFVALNCAAIPPNLIESEIFGHIKGAFTGATASRSGAAVMADGGTLFLDEICEMPLDLQTKLLRFIQTGQVVPVGSNTPVDVNVRFVCATNRIPAEEVAAGRFREDLFYRLHVVPIHMPALHSRGNDVTLIAHTMLSRFSAEENKTFETISPEAEKRLLAHTWPGNVRELGNVIQSTVVLNDGPELTADMLKPTLGVFPAATPASVAGTTVTTGTAGTDITSTHATMTQAPLAMNTAFSAPGQIEPFAVSERRIMEQAIALSGGKVRKAAKAMQINPSTLYRKLERWRAEDIAALEKDQTA